MTTVVTISHGRRASQNFIIQIFLNWKESSSSDMPDLHEFKTVFRFALSITVQKLWAFKVLNTVFIILKLFENQSRQLPQSQMTNILKLMKLSSLWQPQPDRWRPSDPHEQVDRQVPGPNLSPEGRTPVQDEIRITPEVGRKLNGEKTFALKF